MTSNHKGNVAELEIATAAAKLGIPVLMPLTEHARFDLAFEIGNRLWRVQRKWGRLAPEGDTVMVRIGGSRCSPNGYVRTTYAVEDVDLFGIYCGELDRSFLLPSETVAGKTDIRLRLRPTRNGQRACTTLGAEFDFEGAIAQLGERCRGTAEVVGSSPTSSIPHEPTVLGANTFRDKFGYWMDRVAAGEEVVITRRGRPRIRLTPAPAAAPARAP